MKGGIAAYLIAVETLHRLGVPLAGDVCFCTVTDEESSGAGGFAAVARGVKADAGLIGEPTGLDAWVACRGSLTPHITVEGRAGHAEIVQPHWTSGGAVNAIDKMRRVLDEVKAIGDDWRTRPDQQHPLLSPGTIEPTIIRGGTWDVTIPASCELVCELHVPAAARRRERHRPAHRARSSGPHRPCRRRRPLVRRSSAALVLGR